MNSLEAVEKLRIRHEQEAQQCIEIFRSFCQELQSIRREADRFFSVQTARRCKRKR